MTIPGPPRWRMWVLYRGKSDGDRYYSCRELYDAPDRKVYDRKLIDTGDWLRPARKSLRRSKSCSTRARRCARSWLGTRPAVFPRYRLGPLGQFRSVASMDMGS
jgi:hypothetical protein